LTLALAASACRPEPQREPAGAQADGVASEVHRADAAAELPGAAGPEEGAMVPIDDSLRFSLHAPARAAPGAAVPIELRLTNVASDSITLYLVGREITFDIEVRDASDALIWRRLEGQAVPQILQVRFLAPGETLTLRDMWPQRTNDGRPVPAG